MRADTKQMIRIQRGANHIRELAMTSLEAAAKYLVLSSAEDIPEAQQVALRALADAYGKHFDMLVEAGFEWCQRDKTPEFEKMLGKITGQLKAIDDARLDLMLAERENLPLP